MSDESVSVEPNENPNPFGENAAVGDMALIRRRRSKGVSPRFKAWKFEIRESDQRPKFVEPMQYLAYANHADDSCTGLVYFRHQLTPPRRHIRCATFTALPGDTLHAEIQTLLDEDDIVQFGKPPYTRAEAGSRCMQRYDDALQAAKEGRWDDIPADIRFKHEKNLELIHQKHKKRLLEDKVADLENTKKQKTSSAMPLVNPHFIGVVKSDTDLIVMPNGDLINVQTLTMTE